MKRHGCLWEQVVSFPALLRAAMKACRGKRFRPGVAEFHFHLETELWRLHQELRHRSYQPGEYRSFFIYEPKERQISAAPYRDRVVHHALVNVLEPIYEATFISDSFACRLGRRTCARPTATGTSPRTATIMWGSVRRALCGKPCACLAGIRGPRSRGACLSVKSRSRSRVVSGLSRLGQMKSRPGRSGRP